VTYKTIGAKFDKTYRESALSGDGKKVVADALAKGIFGKDEKGNVIAKLPGLPDKVVLRADGTAVYITTDLELTVKKMKENRLTRSVWVVGNEQNLHFKQLFGIVRLLGYKWADALEHLSYGLVNLPEGRMKSREGTVVDADELIAKLSEFAAEQIKERHDFLDEREVEKRAEEIALGALKFYLLESSAKTDIVFDPNAAISFTGRTGPYLQYTNARILSVLRKAANEKSHAGRIDTSKLTEPTEWQLILALARFPEVIIDAAAAREPSTLSKYCYELAKAFSEFYENVPVLKADDAVRRARLCLLRSVQTVLSRGLNILGIPTPKEM
jgi:arginyl-tRNA synthetase